MLLKVKGESNRFCLRRNSASSEPSSPWPMIFGNQYLSNVNMRFTMSVCTLGGFKLKILDSSLYQNGLDIANLMWLVEITDI